MIDFSDPPLQNTTLRKLDVNAIFKNLEARKVKVDLEVVVLGVAFKLKTRKSKYFR